MKKFRQITSLPSLPSPPRNETDRSPLFRRWSWDCPSSRHSGGYYLALCVVHHDTDCWTTFFEEEIDRIAERFKNPSRKVIRSALKSMVIFSCHGIAKIYETVEKLGYGVEFSVCSDSHLC